MKLILTNNLTKVEYTYTVQDVGHSRINYEIELKLDEGLDDGEYSFKLFDNNKLVSRGLAIIGDFVPETTTYTKTEDGYIQYES
jgi:hypothetical protein